MSHTAAVTDEEDIRSRASKVRIAWATSDILTLDALIASEYHHVDIYGVVCDRAGWLEYAAQPRSPGLLTVRSEQIEVLGDVAVLTSTIFLSDLADGLELVLTEVWAKFPSGWQRRWYHATSVTPAE